jgi:ribosomal protein L37AE/L43A
MAVDKVETPNEACPFCGEPVAYIHKATDLKTIVWYCPACFSIWGNAGSSEDAKALLDRLSPRDS